MFTLQHTLTQEQIGLADQLLIDFREDLGATISGLSKEQLYACQIAHNWRCNWQSAIPIVTWIYQHGGCVLDCEGRDISFDIILDEYDPEPVTLQTTPNDCLDPE